MGYLFLSIALLCGGAKGYCGKKISSYTSEYRSAMLANFIRMLLCILIGFVFVMFDGGFESLRLDKTLLPIYLLSGVATSLFVVCWLLSVRRGAYMLVDVFLTIGILIPISLSAIFYNETIKWNQALGLIMLFISVIITCSYNNQIKAKLNPRTALLLLLTALAGGFSDFSQKLFVNNSGGATPSAFNLYTYIFSAATLLIFFLLTAKGGGTYESLKSLRSSWAFIAVMAICLFGNSYFKTLATGRLDAITLYPINQGIALALSCFISSFFFGEKIKPRLILGICTTFIGLLIINLL